jgi:hypothetical protein
MSHNSCEKQFARNVISKKHRDTKNKCDAASFSSSVQYYTFALLNTVLSYRNGISTEKNIELLSDDLDIISVRKTP